MTRQVFYSFHFDNDVLRVHQIRNIGALEDNKPVSVNDWETVKRGGPPAIKKWIDDNMQGRSCVIVLIGTETANRPWVRHEIIKAWTENKGLLGIYIHNINCPNNGKCSPGKNPFDEITFKSGKKMSEYIKCYNPISNDAYNSIRENIEYWVETAIANRQ